MQTHFPQCTEPKQTKYINQLSINTSDLNYTFDSWLSTDKVKLALTSFKDKKTPGPDGMKPIVFKYFPDSTIKQLQLVYKAVIKLHFTPTIWKEA